MNYGNLKKRHFSRFLFFRYQRLRGLTIQFYSHHSLVLIFALQLNFLTLASFYDEDKIVAWRFYQNREKKIELDCDHDCGQS